MNKDELKKILKDHEKWLVGGAGMRADLSGADLSGANLAGATLAGATLRDANLRRADLSGANLSGANFSSANLHRSNLIGANLSSAHLVGADLSRSYLRRADLSGANINGANFSSAHLIDADLRDVRYNEYTAFFALQCPEEGAFVAWKKCEDDVIVKLLIPEDAKRSSATSRKCRASKAIVLEVIGAEKAVSTYDKTFVYEVGKEVLPDLFDDNRWNECSNGINFFLTRKEAENY